MRRLQYRDIQDDLSCACCFIFLRLIFSNIVHGMSVYTVNDKQVEQISSTD
jgi:hypothetical protein